MRPKHTDRGDVTLDQPTAFEHALTTLRSRAELTWSDSNGTHSVVLHQRAVAGSAASVDVVVSDAAVSRLHAELDVRPDGLWVRDLESKNGTYIDGVRVSVARVPDGGKLRLGPIVMVVNGRVSPSPIDLWPDERFHHLIGRSIAMRELFARLARVAPTPASVLIQGETGTGKELVARSIHDGSPRASQPYVIVDCASLPEHLLEAELFGHSKGAFTGAVNARAGAFETAQGGTVFLDEIGDMPLSMQPKLLRVLESRSVRRLGESHYRAVDVRFLSATHRDLRTMVNAGAFREDLYFRLAVLPVSVPSLRQRPEDIAPLVEHFLAKERASVFTREDLAEMAAQPWLGNVRELRNFVERARTLGRSEALAMHSQETGVPSSPSSAPRSPPPPRLPEEAVERAASGVPEVSIELPFKDMRERWVDYLEREYVKQQLAKHGRNVPAIAAAAGVDRTYIYRLIRRYDL